MITRLKMASKIKFARWAFNCGCWTPSEQDWILLACGLDSEDKEIVGKFVFKSDTKSAMIGRFLIKKFVSEVTGLPWKDINVLRDSEHGKPYFPHEYNVQFNISHCGDFVVLAGEMNRPNIYLGIDLMKIEKQRTASVPDFFRLMSKQFAPEEWEIVKSQRTEPEQMAMFYRFWCLKESFTKATGTGITVDLQNISFKLNNLVLLENSIVTDTEVFVGGIKQIKWRFEESLVDKNHIVAVAIKTPEASAEVSEDHIFTHLTFSEVVSQHQEISQPDEDYCRKFMAKKIKN